MNIINIDEVIIPQKFSNSLSNSRKYREIVNAIKRGKSFPIGLDSNNLLVNGYNHYLAYKELGYTEIPYIPKEEIVAHKTEIFERDNYTCYICERTLPYKELMLGFLVPRAKGGSCTYDNVKCSCVICGGLKGNLTFSEELKELIRDELKERNIL